MFPPKPSCHKRANPPLLPTGSTANNPIKPNFIRIHSILFLKLFVSIRNKKSSFLSFTNWQRSRTVVGFPSPRQFQLRRIMALGGAAQQPPPILKCLSSVLASPSSPLPLDYPRLRFETLTCCVILLITW